MREIVRALCHFLFQRLEGLKKKQQEVNTMGSIFGKQRVILDPGFNSFNISLIL